VNLGPPPRKREGEGAYPDTRETHHARNPASRGAPIWAGLIALADQVAHCHLGFVNPALYRIAASPAYRAAPGWDPVTGLGSPDAQWLVPLLARFAQH
jgi:hypothetical protein